MARKLLTSRTKYRFFTALCRHLDAVLHSLLDMSDGDLIDSRVSLKQCTKAIEALHSHQLKKNEKYEQDQLLPAKEQHIWLNVTVKTIPTAHKLKPVKMYADML